MPENSVTVVVKHQAPATVRSLTEKVCEVLNAMLRGNMPIERLGGRKGLATVVARAFQVAVELGGPCKQEIRLFVGATELFVPTLEFDNHSARVDSFLNGLVDSAFPAGCRDALEVVDDRIHVDNVREVCSKVSQTDQPAKIVNKHRGPASFPPNTCHDEGQVCSGTEVNCSPETAQTLGREKDQMVWGSSSA